MPRGVFLGVRRGLFLVFGFWLLTVKCERREIGFVLFSFFNEKRDET